LIYRPLETKLLKLARKMGIATVTGLDMFLAQGFAQWEIWTETKAPETAMCRAVLSKLKGEEKQSRAR
jgi:shikimate dehydrogenase